MDSTENTSGPQPVPSPAEYEACAPGALPHAQMELVRAIHEKAVSAFGDDLAIRMEMQVATQLAPPQPLSRAAFVQSVEEGGCLIALDAEPLRGQALVAFSQGLMGRLLRNLLGAPAGSENDARPVTEIEMHILGEIFESFERELNTAWKTTGIAFRRNSAGPSQAAAQGAMLVFECRLDFDDAQETLRIAVPAFLSRLAALLSAPAAAEEAPAPVREMLLSALRRGNVTVEAVLSGSTLRMEDLLAMEPGHVLMLAQPANAPVDCLIGGKPKFRGECINHANRQALVLM